jgi:hypothetical protein
MRTICAVALAGLTSIGCTGMGSQLTPAEIEGSGTRTFAAPKKDVFKATMDALKAQGFDIAIQNRTTGFIKTDRRGIRTLAVGGAGSAQAVTYHRQYTVTMKQSADGKTRVTARPAIYAGEHDISERPIWALSGPEGERTLWSKLFRDIDEALGETASVATKK